MPGRIPIIDNPTIFQDLDPILFSPGCLVSYNIPRQGDNTEHDNFFYLPTFLNEWLDSGCAEGFRDQLRRSK
jgi:hypothetical protein